jgi:Protein of unknown function (DUF2917)
MDTSISTAFEPLAHGTLKKLRNVQGHGVAVLSGRLWVTQDGDPRDNIVDAGECMRFDRPGLVILQALADTRMLRLDPIAAPVPASRPSAMDAYFAARRQRDAVVGEWLVRLVSALRRPWTRA